MLDLYDELKTLTARLDSDGVAYALCGGLAMAVYGLTRATVDIDLLIPEECLNAAEVSARDLGYTISAAPMSFAGGAVEIRRISKLDPGSGDLLMLDLLLVTSSLAEVWRTRQEVEWEHGSLWVVSRSGLIALKRLRSSGQDLDDIARLMEDADEA
jgi:hypothetical protein